MSTLTERNREVAYEMFKKDATSQQVATRIRKPVASVRALRANWTRSNTSSKSSRSSSRSTSSRVTPLTINVSRSRLEAALKSGAPVQLVIK